MNLREIAALLVCGSYVYVIFKWSKKLEASHEFEIVEHSIKKSVYLCELEKAKFELEKLKDKYADKKVSINKDVPVGVEKPKKFGALDDALKS